jgi:hypothetical protein
MFTPRPTHMRMTERPEVRPAAFIPTVYESVAAEPIRWEYHVLSVDPREAALPEEEQLNSLGNEGWILLNILDERATGRGVHVHYYFIRQLKEAKK